MAKPRIFISSTFYDLRQVRANLDLFIEQLGYDPVRNEEGDIPYGKEEALEEYCYKEIKSVDILVAIIGGRFGSESKRNSSSISQLELKTAINENKQVYISIEKNVLSEFETYLLNKGTTANYRYVDDKRIYEFIEEIKSYNTNNAIQSFETASEITKYLKEQFAGLFQRFLEERTRLKEISLIKGLEKTASTLNKLVNFLSDENKGQSEEINRILTISHPLVERLKSELDIPYNFYIEGLTDLSELLVARGFRLDDVEDFDEENVKYRWFKESNRKKYHLSISEHIFDDDDKLRFIRKSDWDDNYLKLIISEEPDDDDLPF